MRILAAVAVVSVFLLWLNQQVRPPKDAKQATQKAAQLATTEQQKRLWQEAADKGITLESVPVVQQPVETRKPVVVQERKVEAKPTKLPAGMLSGMRILAAPFLPEGRFSGSATVLRAEDERLELDLGQKRLLVLNARLRGGAVRAKAGEQVTLDYQVNDDPYDRRQLLALKTQQGDGLVSVLHGDKKPVELQIPMFQLTVKQVGRPKQQRMNVEVTVGEERQVLTAGQIVEFKQAGLIVGLIASIAYEGEQAPVAEGNPYAINLVAWRSQ